MVLRMMERSLKKKVKDDELEEAADFVRAARKFGLQSRLGLQTR